MKKKKTPFEKADHLWKIGDCPICKTYFKSLACPHSYLDIEEELNYLKFTDRMTREGLI